MPFHHHLLCLPARCLDQLLLRLVEEIHRRQVAADHRPAVSVRHRQEDRFSGQVILLLQCRTHGQAQLALHLHYLEGYSIPEVATELNTSKKYAAKLVSRCLRQAKDRYAKKGASDERD